MKYGIRATDSNNDHTYCISTRSPAFSADTTEIALFVQPQTAVSAVKQLRLSGYERLNDCVLEVVGVEVTVATVIPVEYPAVKKGFIIVGEQRGAPIYFSGPMKLGSDIQWSPNIEQATVFKTPVDATGRIADSEGEAIVDRDKIKAEPGPSARASSMGWRVSADDMQRQNDYQAQRIQLASDYVQWHQSVQIEQV